MRAVVLAVLMAACSFVGCSKEEAGGTAKKATGGVDVLAAKAAAGTVNGRCPVQVDELVDKDAPTRIYKDPTTGKELKVGFCCSKCPKSFDKDPAKYIELMRADPAKFGYSAP